MILTFEHGEVRELRLNRPPANALSPELIATLLRAVQVAPREGKRALVLSGSSGMFSAGLDVPVLLKLEEANPMIFVRQSSVSDYEPVVLTFSQCVAILSNLDGLMHLVLVLADAATGLRISEILALRWSDVDKAHSCIRVTRAYVYGKFGPPKSKASKKPVPLHPLLAEALDVWRKQTPYSADDDLVFPSMRLKGRKPPRANMLVADHLQPAARKAGITEPVGFHTVRRTLASALLANGSDLRLVQELLRHSNPGITLDAYTRSMTPAKIEAQGWVMGQLLSDDVKAALAKGKPASARTM